MPRSPRRANQDCPDYPGKQAQIAQISVGKQTQSAKITSENQIAQIAEDDKPRLSSLPRKPRLPRFRTKQHPRLHKKYIGKQAQIDQMAIARLLIEEMTIFINICEKSSKVASKLQNVPTPCQSLWILLWGAVHPPPYPLP